MKRFLHILLFLCILIITPLYAQDDANKEVKKELKILIKLCKKDKTISYLEQYILNHPDISQNKEHFQYFLTAKASALNDLYYEEIMELPKEIRLEGVKMQEIISLYDEAFTLCQKCQLSILSQKFELYESYDVEDKYNPDQYTMLKSSGFKPMKMGTSLGLRYMHSPQNSWIGGDFSFIHMYQKSYKYSYTDLETQKQVKESVISGNSVAFFSLGYARSLDKSRNEFVFNGISLYSEFTIKPLQFGRQWDDERESFGFYRPEVGYGYGPFYVSAGYNLFFKKSARDEGNHLVLTAGCAYPIFKNSKK